MNTLRPSVIATDQMDSSARLKSSREARKIATAIAIIARGGWFYSCKFLAGAMTKSFLVATLFCATTLAQNVQLTPAQQQMLNSLPTAQRQQALAAIRDLQSGQAVSDSGSINEQIPVGPDADSGDRVSEFGMETAAKADSRSRLVINFSLSESLVPEDVEKIETDPLLQRMVGSHLFVLDDAGILSMQGLEIIPLLGLSEADIQRRLEAEPDLALFDIDVRILAQEPIGIEALEAFGYNVFGPAEVGEDVLESGFDPPQTGPVPPDYVLGPGDNLRVQLFGNVNGIYEYEVSRDGILNLPEIGPVTVAGIPFSEFRADLNSRVQEMLIGTQVSVTMGQLRTIRVFVLGDVNKPGSYVVGGLSTMSGALYRSGGISPVGSMRDLQLKRNGTMVARLDLYDLLINGDNSGDQRLQPGDVIFVPPIGDTISIAGAVKRPAIYETRGRTSVADAVALAGGMSNKAFEEGARLERTTDDNDGGVIAVDLNDAESAAIVVRTGDTLLVPEILPGIENAVALSGHVYRPGTYSWRPGLRLTDLINSPNELKPGVDMNYVLIRRERERGAPIEVVSADLGRALANPGSTDNIALQARDEVHVFDVEFGRQRIIAPIVSELDLQATHELPAMHVEISGTVRAPGIYPLESGMRVSDLIRAGGSLSAEAYALEAELTRYSVSGGSTRVVEVVDIDLAAVLRDERNSDLVLSSYDFLSIRRIPEWDARWTVYLEGEVRFPGEYRVKRGESLSEVLQRAGGLTDAAFAQGSVFLRESLKEREQEQLELLARRLESDLTSLSLQLADSGGSETLSTGKALLDQLRTTEAVGRLVINTRHLADTASDRDVARIELRDGDRLLVPPRSQVVTVIGETQQNTSHLYVPSTSRNDYIDLSGGLTRRADKKRIYVVRANGAVVARRSSWFRKGDTVDIQPGDTIVVPLDADRIRPLTFWTNIATIVYQGAIAIAAVNSFD